MEGSRGLFCLMFLCLLMHVRGQGDFDLADALDDLEPTKKPNSDIYPRPKPPYRPQPGDPSNGGNIYPRPKPQPRPQPGSSDHGGGYFSDVDRDDGRYPPRPRPPAGGGGGYNPGYDGYGNTHGGGRYRPNSHGSHGGGGYTGYDNTQGNTVAKIVSPIVSVVVVTLVGAAASYFQYNRRRNCFRTHEPENI